MSLYSAVRKELDGLTGVLPVTEATALALAEIIDNAEAHQVAGPVRELRATMVEARTMGVPKTLDPIDAAREKYSA